MKKPKTKTILKYALIAYLLYLVLSLPKKDWDNARTLTSTDKNGKIVRYQPKQSSYASYLIAWWEDVFQNKGLSYIVDEHILAPIGIKFENE